MKTRILYSFCFTLFLICYSFNVCSHSNQEIKIESLSYFNAIRSFKAEFIQTNSASNVVQHGVVLMKKPGLLKWDYYPPTPASIIIQGTTISYYDKELEEYSYSTLSNPIINLLSSNIKNTETLNFLNIRTIDNKKIITIQDNKTQLQADIIFNIDPITIVGLEISNPDSTTYIQFYNIQNNITIKETEFKHNISFDN